MKKAKNPDVPAELSEAVMHDSVCITIAGEREVTIENYRGIIAYDPNSVKVNTRGKIVKISGENLTLSHITDEILSILGDVSGVEFI